MEARDGDGCAPIHLAALSGRTDLLELFLEAGQPVDFPRPCGRTPLHLAAACARGDAVAWLLASGASVKARARDGFAALHFAADAGDPAVIDTLCAAGAPVDGIDVSGRTPIFFAAWSEDNPEAVRALLEHGASVDHRDDQGSTALHHPANMGFLEACGALLEAGADPNAQDSYGNTPLYFAVRQGHTEVAELLLAAGADPNIQDEEGNTPLHCAARRHGVAYPERGAPKQAPRGEERVTPAQPARIRDGFELVGLLLDSGADPTIRNGHGQTPMDLAVSSRVEAVLKEAASDGEKPSEPSRD
jgi:cytohesin